MDIKSDRQIIKTEPDPQIGEDKSGKQLLEAENMSSLKIFRYRDNSLKELEDQIGVESTITVNLDNGNQITLPCTSIHLEELALGIAFSQNPGSRITDDSVTPYDPISYEKVLICLKEFSSASPLFKATGSVHSGQLLDGDYNVLFFTEDMGRHNVIDKIIGFGLKNNLDYDHCLLMISSRMPLELVEKVYKTGIKNIASVSAPTKNAALFAREKNMNLIGMYRDSRFNVYSK
ncbi:MAG: formate dehydrogenase accessory sulfurtransferase FdhD [Peptostreptococcaceae bacterium]|nr:formate dehydrogenase accessory sulfurtransferase FdhD [Peptostreptococcaceae bacterium]